MTIDSAPPDGPPEAARAAHAVDSPAAAGWPWRRAARFLAGAAQLITISALAGADPIPAAGSSLLLAVAPAPVAPAAAFVLAPVNLLVAVAGAAVLTVGIAGQLTHTVLFFVPALVMLAAADGLWREQAITAGEGVRR